MPATATERMTAAEYLEIVGSNEPLGPLAVRPGEMHARPYFQTILKISKWSGVFKPEDAISAEFYRRLVKALRDGRYSGIFCHVPNEGKRGKAHNALLRAVGLIPGAYDWWLMGEWGSGVIEFKVLRGRKTAHDLLSENQGHFSDWCADMRVNHAACGSADEAWDVLLGWGAFG